MRVSGAQGTNYGFTDGRRTCDCGCNRTFVPPSFAPHKRFATAECRNRWHLQRRKAALRKLEDAEAAATASPTVAGK